MVEKFKNMDKQTDLKDRLKDMTHIRFCLLEMLLDVDKHIKYLEFGYRYGDIDFLEDSYFELGCMIRDIKIEKYEKE